MASACAALKEPDGIRRRYRAPSASLPIDALTGDLYHHGTITVPSSVKRYQTVILVFVRTTQAASLSSSSVSACPSGYKTRVHALLHDIACADAPTKRVLPCVLNEISVVSVVEAVAEHHGKRQYGGQRVGLILTGDVGGRPCTGSYMARRQPLWSAPLRSRKAACQASVSIAAQSDRMSPNRLSVTITSNCFGARTNCIAQLSAYMCCSSIPKSFQSQWQPDATKRPSP